MAQPQQEKGSSPDSNSPVQGHPTRSPYPLDSEAGFTVAASTGPPSGTSTFMQNQITLQRSPSNTQIQLSALNRQLSVRSNGSIDSALSPVGINAVVANEVGAVSRGRTGSSSGGSIEEAMNNCSLEKKLSNRSTRSVRSIPVVGSFPLGSLRVHSPSPTRSPYATSHACQKSGDVFVIRDVPAGVLVGYDTQSLFVETDHTFDGIRYLPPGAHFIWAGLPGRDRTGFWIMTQKLSTDEFGEIFVKTWNKYTELLEEEQTKAELKIQRDTLPEYFETLQEYKVRNAEIVPTGADTNLWRQVTSCIKGAMLTRVTGYKWNEWQISSHHDYSDIAPGQKDIEWDAKKVLHNIFPKEGRTFSKTSVGSERTEQALDTSSHLQAIIQGVSTYEDSDEIVGEMQFCYITGMLLGNMSCIEHFSHMVKTVFRAFKYLMLWPEFGRKVIKATHAILLFDAEAFSDDASIFDHDAELENKLKVLFTSFKVQLDDFLLETAEKSTEHQRALGKSFADLEAYLWKKGWDLRGTALRSGKLVLDDGEVIDVESSDYDAEEERGEYAPVIVELNDDGREKGLVAF